MYCYSLGIIDRFNGTHILSEFYEKSPYENDSLRDHYDFTKEEILKFVNEAFFELANMKGDWGWELDCRSPEEIRLFFIPYETTFLSKALLIKQDNNGSTFCVSEHQINLPDWELMMENRETCQKCLPLQIKNLAWRAVNGKHF